MIVLHAFVLIPVVFSAGFLAGTMWVVWHQQRRQHFD